MTTRWLWLWRARVSPGGSRSSNTKNASPSYSNSFFSGEMRTGGAGTLGRSCLMLTSTNEPVIGAVYDSFQRNTAIWPRCNSRDCPYCSKEMGPSATSTRSPQVDGEAAAHGAALRVTRTYSFSSGWEGCAGRASARTRVNERVTDNTAARDLSAGQHR